MAQMVLFDCLYRIVLSILFADRDAVFSTVLGTS